jgi:cytidylate kinase
MNTYPSLEKARVYLDLQMSRPGHNRRVSIGPFITLSRESGSDAPAIAEELRQRLDRRLTEDQPSWGVFDRNIVEKMLEHYQLSASLAKFLPEDKISQIDSSVGEILGRHPSIWTLVHQSNGMMRRLAGMGNVVLVGRGANFATAGLARGFHVRLVGSPENRARRVAEVRGFSLEHALAYNRRTDIARRDYVRSYFDAEIADPATYDLIINRDHFSVQQTADLVMRALEARDDLLPTPEPGLPANRS